MTRVLMVLTSHDRLGDTGAPTGFYLSEAAHPWKVFSDAGFTVEYASPAGGQVPIDGQDLDDPVQQAFLDDEVAAQALETTASLDEVFPVDYDAVFLVGGHGTMWDFPGDRRLQQLIADVHDGGGVVAAVCHGPAGLVDVRTADGAWLVDGREVACFTDEEERAVELDQVVPFLLQSRLEERGATTQPAEAFTAQVVVDGRLATGQNPPSATPLAERVVELATHG